MSSARDFIQDVQAHICGDVYASVSEDISLVVPARIWRDTYDICQPEYLPGCTGRHVR